MREQAFLADFAALEVALAQDCTIPAERLIVELGLTARRVAILRRALNIDLSWFHDAYGAMRRHGLIPRGTSWTAWLRRYRAQRKRYTGSIRRRRAKPRHQ